MYEADSTAKTGVPESSGAPVSFFRRAVFTVVSAVLGVAVYSLIILLSQYPPSREALGEESYRAAWTTIVIGGAVAGVVVYFIIGLLGHSKSQKQEI